MSTPAPAVVAYALTRYAQLTQTFVDGEIRELRRRGTVVWVFALERGQLDRSDDARTAYLDALGGSTVRDNVRALLRHPVRYATFLRRGWALRSELGPHSDQVPWRRLPSVARWLEQSGVQVLHAHFGWSGAAAAAGLGALLGVPWSVTLHANDIFSQQRNLVWKLRNADLTVTVSDDNRRWMASALPSHPAPAVLTCGIALPDRGWRRPEPSVDIVLVGRLIPKKGVDLLIRAVRLLADRGLEPTVEIVGEGALREDLEALSASLGAEGQVSFLGSLPHTEALARISAARVFCLPCRIAPDGDRDAVPTVIIEAMARGVPVVSTAEVGVPELVDETCGRLVPPEDVEALAEAIEQLLRDPQLASRLGAAGSERARQRFSVEGQVALLAELLGRTVSSRP